MAAELQVTIIDQGGSPTTLAGPSPVGGPSGTSGEMQQVISLLHQIATPQVLNAEIPNVLPGDAPGRTPEASKASKALDKTIDEFSAKIQSLSQVTGKLASNDNLGGLTSAVSSAASSLGALGPAGVAAVAAIGVATAAVVGFAYTVNAFVARGREISQYSGALTTANVTADVRSLMADIREAQQLGDPLARLTDAQSDFNAELREILLPIKRLLIEGLGEALPIIVDVMKAVAEGIKTIDEAIPGGGINVAIAAIRAWAENTKQVLNLIGVNTTPIKKDELTSDQMEDLLSQQLDALNPFNLMGRAMDRPKDIGRGGAKQRLNRPPFARGMPPVPPIIQVVPVPQGP